MSYLKLSAYECGFNAFDDARMKFDVRFYLVAILFIIFDLEVAFLFPWAVAFGQIGIAGRSPYSCTKAALIQFTKCLAIDHAADGIRANSLSPGGVDTARILRRFANREDGVSLDYEMNDLKPGKRQPGFD